MPIKIFSSLALGTLEADFNRWEREEYPNITKSEFKTCVITTEEHRKLNYQNIASYETRDLIVYYYIITYIKHTIRQRSQEFLT